MATLRCASTLLILLAALAARVIAVPVSMLFMALLICLLLAWRFHRVAQGSAG